jgi:osmotically-inducible protein OsmY
VKDQEVTLTGTVESWGERTLAGRVAKQVDGVQDLANRIAVRIAMQRPDAEIAAEIEEILAWDVLVDDDLIEVAVDDGGVTLSGQVGSLAEKSRAINQSWVAGVKSVAAEELEVSGWARDPRFRKQKYARLDKPDADVAKAVRDALARDPRVLGQDVQVRVDDGKAVLTGTVNGPKAKRAAASTARGTLGVYRVKNRLRVRTDMPDDEVLEERVRKAIERNPMLMASEITVSVTNGVAGLSGIVGTWYEKAEADDAAAAVAGVRAVDNDLLVEDNGGAFVADPYVDWDWYAYDFDWYGPSRAPLTAKSDWAIAEDVRDEIFWSPFVDSDDVTVTVDDGEVRLTGTVDTWSERQTAAENAYEGGAGRVDNDLRVRYGPDYYAP